MRSTRTELTLQVSSPASISSSAAVRSPGGDREPFEGQTRLRIGVQTDQFQVLKAVDDVAIAGGHRQHWVSVEV